MARKSILFQKQIKRRYTKSFFFFSKEIEYVLRKVEDLFYNTNISIQTKATTKTSKQAVDGTFLRSLRNLIGSFSARRKPCYFENFSSPFPRPLVDEKFGPVGSRGFDIVERMVRGGARTRLTRKRERERIRRRDEGKRGERDEKRDE